MSNARLFKKILVVLLTAVMVIAIFAACTQDDTDDIQQTTSDFDDEVAPTPEDEETVIQTDGTDSMIRILPNLYDYDWGGHVFRVLSTDWGESPEWTAWNPRDIVAEEMTGNPLNDAVYRRNSALEERYNFTVEHVMVRTTFVQGSSYIDVLRRAVSAGDNHFDVISIGLGSAATVAQEGLLVDLFDVHYLDFEQPYWDQGAVRDLAVGNRLFFTNGDFNLVNRDAMPVILFNKQLLADLQLDCPYELVRNGKWTIDTMYTMSRAAAADLGGHGGQLNPESDRFGFVPSFVGLGLRHGVGVRTADIDSDGMPVLTFASERNFNAVIAVHDLMNASFTMQLGAAEVGVDPALSEPERIFTEGRGLFKGAAVRTVENLRGSETDFGILPMPWLDEHQGEWNHMVSALFGRAIAIPSFHDGYDLDRVGFILEAISAESRYTVIPTHHDIQLQGQFIRDEESSEMLDVIFGSTVWDLGVIYNWVSFNIQMSVGTGRLASDWERHLVRTENAMQATVDALANIG